MKRINKNWIIGIVLLIIVVGIVSAATQIKIGSDATKALYIQETSKQYAAYIENSKPTSTAIGLYLKGSANANSIPLYLSTSGTNYLSYMSSNNSNKTHIRPIKSAFALEPVWVLKCNSGQSNYTTL
jgi:hypothetical protein